MGNSVLCPKCKSDQLAADKKGLSGKKALAGAVIAGPLGLLAGTIGSNKVKITCLNCGHTFNPGEGAKEMQEPKSENYGKPLIDKQASPYDDTDRNKYVKSMLSSGAYNRAVTYIEKDLGLSEKEAQEYVNKISAIVFPTKSTSSYLSEAEESAKRNRTNAILIIGTSCLFMFLLLKYC